MQCSMWSMLRKETAGYICCCSTAVKEYQEFIINRRVQVVFHINGVIACSLPLDSRARLCPESSLALWSRKAHKSYGKFGCPHLAGVWCHTLFTQRLVSMAGKGTGCQIARHSQSIMN
jgi:hypothetical protein